MGLKTLERERVENSVIERNRFGGNSSFSYHCIMKYYNWLGIYRLGLVTNPEKTQFQTRH